MTINFQLNTWRVQRDKESNVPKLVGKYEIVMNGKIIAGQGFNEGYGSSELPFSGELVQQIISLEERIIAEIQKLIT